MGTIQHLLRIICASVLVSSKIHGQMINCPMLQDSQLGNSSVLSSDGLLVDALLAGSGDATSSLQILETNTVCLGQGTVRDTYRSISVVVRYRREDDSEATVQVEYQCTDGEWGFGSQPSVTIDPEGNTTTLLRTDCSLCISPNLTSAILEISAEEHCIACPSSCVGLMSCGGFPDTTCCNYFDMGNSCVEACPANSQPNNITFVCECLQGYMPTDSGRSCLNIDECQANPCENGGTCTDTEGDFSCQCLEDWSGVLCDTCFLFGCVNCSAQPEQNRTVCTECDESFDLSNDICNCAITGCSECSINGTCETCDDNHRLTSDSMCEPEETNTPTEATEFPTALIVGVAVGLVVLVLLLCIIVTVGIACTCPCDCWMRGKGRW